MSLVIRFLSRRKGPRPDGPGSGGQRDRTNPERERDPVGVSRSLSPRLQLLFVFVFCFFMCLSSDVFLFFLSYFPLLYVFFFLICVSPLMYFLFFYRIFPFFWVYGWKRLSFKPPLRPVRLHGCCAPPPHNTRKAVHSVIGIFSCIRTFSRICNQYAKNR